MIGLRTLVLNATYLPINYIPVHSIPVEDAITRVFNGTCHVVEEYDRKIKTPSLDMNWPSVIARNDFVSVRPAVRLSRESLYYRDHGVCVYCERPLTVREVTYDHYIPRKHGGEKVWENVVAACTKCNSLKGDAEPVGIWEPKHKPYRPNYHQLVANRKKFPLIIEDNSWMGFFEDWEHEVIVRGEKYAA